MRIALGLEYPISLRGGVSILVETLLKEFARRNHEVVLISPDSAATLNESGIAGLVRKHVPWDPPGFRHSQPGLLADQLMEAGVQLAHFHMGGVYGWGNRVPNRCPIAHLNRRGIPCFSTVHLVVSPLDGFCGPQRPLWFKLLLLPLAWSGKLDQLRNVRAEIAVSRHDYDKLRRWYWPLRKRFVQIYHSRLSQALTPAPVVEREPVILNVGHLAWRKGQAVLAEAFAGIAQRYPEWKLQLAGHEAEDATREEIRRIAQANRLELRILFLGQRDDALDLMRRAAIYVQPSFWEALGLALQEAMSCGCPAIGSCAGGIPELIDDGRTGFLVEPGNVSQLSVALERLMREPLQRQQLGQAAAASIRAKGMTVESMVQRHLELYATAIRKK